MTIRQDIFMALHDAIGWQSGLADAYHSASPERQKCLQQIGRYRAILKKWYGTDKTKFDQLIAECKLVEIKVTK